MRHSKRLILPLALLLSGGPIWAQLDEDLTVDLEAIAADEDGEAGELATQSREAAKEPMIEPEGANSRPQAQEVGALAAKLASLVAEGNGEAAYHLGMIYHLGVNGVDKDPRKAFELFERAAEAGDPLGAYKLGSFYDGQGEGVVEDDAALAIKYKQIAADAGYSLAQHDVARLLYEQGRPDQAVDYLLASAKQGYLPSLQALASLYSGEGKVPKDPVRQFAYVALLQAMSGEEPSKRIQEWRDKMQAEMSEEQLKQAIEIVQSWKVEPTQITRKALAGEAEALKLAGLQPARPQSNAADSKEAKEGR